MSSLNSLNHAQQQIFLHVLQEMEARGVKDLDTARKLVRESVQTTHRKFISRRGQRVVFGNEKTAKCSECGGIMVVATHRDRTPVDAGDGMVVQVCRKCRFSRLVALDEVI